MGLRTPSLTAGQKGISVEHKHEHYKGAFTCAVTVQDNLDEFALYSSKPIEVEWCAGVPTRDDPSQRLVADHPRIPTTPETLLGISHPLHLDSLRLLRNLGNHRNTLATTERPLCKYGHKAVPYGDSAQPYRQVRLMCRVTLQYHYSAR